MWARSREDKSPKSAGQPTRSSSIVLLLVKRGLRPLLKRLAVPDHAFARIVREFEILCEFERIHRARILAQPAKHTPAQIVGESCEFLAARLLVTFAAYDNQILRTSQRAQIARDTHGF